MSFHRVKYHAEVPSTESEKTFTDELLPSPEKISPGDLYIDRQDVAARLEHQLILCPNVSVQLTIEIPRRWHPHLNKILAGQLHGGIHLRSCLAQAQIDLEIISKAVDANGRIKIKLTNLSQNIYFANQGETLKIGNLYCFQAGLVGKELDEVLSETHVGSNGNSFRPIKFAENESAALAKQLSASLSYQLSPAEIIGLPIGIALVATKIGLLINLINLPSGPDRVALHAILKLISLLLNNEGLSHQYDDMHPFMYLAATPGELHMPKDTGLILIAAGNVPISLNENHYLDPHGSSRIHTATVKAPGTSGILVDEQYTHLLILELLRNGALNGSYPKYLFCQVVKVIMV